MGDWRRSHDRPEDQAASVDAENGATQARDGHAAEGGAREQRPLGLRDQAEEGAADSQRASGRAARYRAA